MINNWQSYSSFCIFPTTPMIYEKNILYSTHNRKRAILYNNSKHSYFISLNSINLKKFYSISSFPFSFKQNFTVPQKKQIQNIVL